MELTIFSAFFQWAVNGVVAGVVANFTYDSLKSIKGLLKQRIKGYFLEESQADVFIEASCCASAKIFLSPKEMWKTYLSQ